MSLSHQIADWSAALGDRTIFGTEIRRMKGFFVALALVLSHFVFFVLADDGIFNFRQVKVMTAFREAGHAHLANDNDFVKMLADAKRRSDRVAFWLSEHEKTADGDPVDPDKWRKLAEELGQASPLLTIRGESRYVRAPLRVGADVLRAVERATTAREAAILITALPFYRSVGAKRKVKPEPRTAYVWCAQMNGAKQTCRVELEADLIRMVRGQLAKTTQFMSFSGPRITRSSHKHGWSESGGKSMSFSLPSSRSFISWNIDAKVIDVAIGGGVAEPVVNVAMPAERSPRLVSSDCIEELLASTKSFRINEADGLEYATKLCTVRDEDISPPETFFCGLESDPGKIAVCPVAKPDSSITAGTGSLIGAGLIKGAPAPAAQSFTFNRVSDRLAISLFENAVNDAGQILVAPSDDNDVRTPALILVRTVVADYATIFGVAALPPALAKLIDEDAIRERSRSEVLEAFSRQPQLIAYYEHRNLLAPLIYHNLTQQLTEFGLLR